MKELPKKVMHKQTVVGEVTVPVYETLSELTENEIEERILSMFNKQNAVRIMGNERAKHAIGRAGKKKRMGIAFNLLDSEELATVAGDFDALQGLLESKDVQARVDEYLSTDSDAAADVAAEEAQE